MTKDCSGGTALDKESRAGAPPASPEVLKPRLIGVFATVAGCGISNVGYLFNALT